MSNSYASYPIKQTDDTLTVKYNAGRSDPGLPEYEALAELIRVSPPDAILVWGKPGVIMAVKETTKTGTKKDRRGGRQKIH